MRWSGLIKLFFVILLRMSLFEVLLIVLLYLEMKRRSRRWYILKTWYKGEL